MKLLIVGGVGYIGSQVIRDISKDIYFKDFTIRIFDSFLKERYNSIMNLPTNIKYEFIEGDIRNLNDVEEALKDVDIVVDLSGITNAPLSFERKDLTTEVNVNGLKNLIDVSIKNKIKRFIYLSSCSVYGPTKEEVNEMSICIPVSPYAESKIKAEEECNKALKEHNLNISILRMGTVYGYSVGMRFDTVINKFVYLACTGKPLTIYETSLNEKRPYIHVKDSSSSILFAIKNKEMIGQTYNVLSRNYSVQEIVECIKKEILRIEIRLTESKVLNQLSFVVDNSKIKSLGFLPRMEIEDGIRELTNKFKAFLI